MSSKVFGIVSPHPPIMVESVGGPRSGVTSASIDALHSAAGLLRRFDPDTVVLMSPHSPAASDAFLVDTAATYAGSFAQFGAPEATYAYSGDSELAQRLLERLNEAGIPAVNRAHSPGFASGELDHAAMVPLHFLDRKGEFPLVEISLSWLSYEQHRALGEQVQLAAEDLGRRIAFVASGDCSHRLTPDAPAGFSPRGSEFDARLVELLNTSDYAGLAHIDPDLVEAAGECGLRSFITLGGVVDDATTRVLSYEGPWGVGYLTAVANEQVVPPTPNSGAKGGLPGSEEPEIVRLARRTIEGYVASGATPTPAPLADAALPTQAGAFVSLHRGGELRGCIGTISPVAPTLAEEVVRNAVEAAVHDPRFPALSADELGDLEIKVDVLHAPEPCTFTDLDPATYGVIVSSGFRRGLLLPDLEGVDTPEQQVAIALRKAGIDSREDVELQRFKVDRYA